MIDIAIIGGGPAGLSAAINAAARNRGVVVFSNKKETGALYKAELVNNYLGMPGQTGAEMTEAFRSHAAKLNIRIMEGRVLQIISMGDYFNINFDNEFYEARTVILAMGVVKAKKIKGEEEFLGRGVSYCATCDGMLYRNKKAVVVSETDDGEDEANFLGKICSDVTYISKLAPEKLNNNINYIIGFPTEVIGSEFVTAIKINDTTIPCDGVFFSKAVTPPDVLIYGLETDGHITVNRLMETNLKGVFACGDCTGWPYQLAKAVGEGLVAAQRADKYLTEAD